MIGWTMLLLLCIVLGTGSNYLGIELIRAALSLFGVEAITNFCFGIIVWLVGCAFHVCMVLVGKLIIAELKGGE